MGSTGANFALAGAQVLSTGAQMFSARKQSKAQAQAITSQGSAEAQMFEQNARLATMQAEDATARGEVEVGQHQRSVKKLLGAQRARLAAQGLDVSADSALDVQAETAQLGALDTLTLRNNAFREAWGYQTQALDYQDRAKMARLTAKAKSKSTILTGGMEVARQGLGLASSFNFGAQSRQLGSPMSPAQVESYVARGRR